MAGACSAPARFVNPRHNGGAGFVPGIPRLGLPDINLADSAYGVRMAALQGRYATALPSVLGMAASWDPDAAFLFGSVIGRELRAMGFNMSIGGGVDLIREPRNGRNFEYASEDPILAGTMVGQLARGVQSNHIMGDIKHYVLNDQETGRNTLNAILDPRAMRETDLLAFQIAIGLAHPAGVMCSYNHINGDYACENDYTLNQVLKHEWGFKGFVLSDWGGTHSTVKAALAGLDMDQPGDDNFFSDATEAGRAQRTSPAGAPRRHGASHRAQHVRRRSHRPAAHAALASSIPSAAATTPSRSKKRAPSCSRTPATSFRSPPQHPQHRHHRRPR